MAFDFRLQKVLEYREKQKKMAQEELVLSQIEFQKIKDELLRLQHEEQKLLQFQQNNQDQALDSLTLFSIDNYRLFLQESYRNSLHALEEQEKKVEEKRQILVECWKNCRILDKLKGNALQEFLQDEKIREQHLNDEISLYGYLRKER